MNKNYQLKIFLAFAFTAVSNKCISQIPSNVDSLAVVYLKSHLINPGTFQLVNSEIIDSQTVREKLWEDEGLLYTARLQYISNTKSDSLKRKHFQNTINRLQKNVTKDSIIIAKFNSTKIYCITINVKFKITYSPEKGRDALASDSYYLNFYPIDSTFKIMTGMHDRHPHVISVKP